MGIDVKKQRKFNQALAMLSEKIDKTDAQSVEEVERIQNMFDALEKKSQKNTDKYQALKEKSLDNDKRVKTLEEMVSNLSTKNAGTLSSKDLEKKEKTAAALDYIHKGVGGLTKEQKSILSTDIDVRGGFLTSSELDNLISKQITEITPVRRIARVKRTTGRTLEIVKRNGIPTATYEGEKSKLKKDTSTYGKVTISTHRVGLQVVATQEQLLASAFNTESEILDDAVEGISNAEGRGFISGSGVAQPQGITTHQTLKDNALTSLVSGEIDATSIILLSGELKTGYNPLYLLNRKTLAKIRTLKDNDGQFLWGFGLDGKELNTLGGMPYVLANDMPDVASSKYALAYGDFRRGYTFLESLGFQVIRDDVTEADEGLVKFTFTKWSSGQVNIPEAIKLLKIKA